MVLMLSAVVVATVENEIIRLGRDIAGALKLDTECLFDTGSPQPPSSRSTRETTRRAGLLRGFDDFERRTSNRPFADDVGHVIVYRRNKGAASAATAREGPRQISG